MEERFQEDYWWGLVPKESYLTSAGCIGTYLHIANIAFTIAQTTQNNWVMWVKVKHEFTGDVFYLNSDIHPRSKTLVLDSGIIILIFKFCSVKLLWVKGKKKYTNGKKPATVVTFLKCQINIKE